MLYALHFLSSFSSPAAVHELFHSLPFFILARVLQLQKVSNTYFRSELVPSFDKASAQRGLRSGVTVNVLVEIKDKYVPAETAVLDYADVEGEGVFCRILPNDVLPCTYDLISLSLAPKKTLIFRVFLIFALFCRVMTSPIRWAIVLLTVSIPETRAKWEFLAVPTTLRRVLSQPPTLLTSKPASRNKKTLSTFQSTKTCTTRRL